VQDLGIFRQKVEQEIRSLLVGTSTPLFGLDTMNAYHMGFSDQNGNLRDGGKGKYLRPLFCIAICAGLSGDPEKAIPPAASIEIAHRTSLIFDDIQDHGLERNNQPTVNALWGDVQAINAGFALSCFARLAAQKGSACGLTPETTLRILFTLENAVIHLCQGQYLDLSFGERVNLVIGDYLGMVEGKTGALFGAAAEVGALCAGANLPTQAVARELGINMGIAFQIWDDYLGIWGDEVVVGKTANDLTEKKRSLPVVLALERYRRTMAGWLQMKTITPEEAKTIRFWMENRQIDQLTVDLAMEYIDRSQTLLQTLKLSPEWQELIDQFLSQVVSRKK
jgi:geranylgeranyl diphosphate synthase type I